MTTYIWSGSGSASTASNWTPNGTPTSGDTVQFGSTSVANCTWDLSVVSIMTIDATYTGKILMNTNCTIEKGLSIGSENCLNSTTATTITFNNATPQYKSNKVYIENNVADPFETGTAKSFLQFEFVANVVPNIDAGIYPHMKFDYGFRPEYIAPTRTENKYTVQMESIFLGAQNVSPTTTIPTSDDRLMNWIITNHTGFDSSYKQIEVKAGSIHSFDAGYGTWTLQGKGGGHTIPVSGNPIYGGWVFTWRNMIIACDRTGAGGGFCSLPHSTILSLTNLTINEGACIKASDSTGGTIHLVNRPNIKGTWGFFPIADGIYHYKGIYNLGVANGGTGLTTVPEGNILFGEDAQLLGNSPNFTYASSTNTLSVGNGGIIVPANSIASPAANQLWVNSADSDKLYFGSSEVGGGGGGGSYTDADAIAAIEGTSSLDLSGDLTMDTAKKIVMDEKTYASATASAGTLELTAEKTGSNSPLLTLRTPTGYLRMGASNTSFCHFYTDRAYFYFNKAIQFDSGQLFAYNDDLQIKTDDSGSGQPTRIFVDAGVDECRVGIGNGFTSSSLPQNTLHVKTTETLGDDAYVARFQTAEGNVGITRYGGIHIDNDNDAPLDGADWSSERWQISQRDTNHLDIAYGTPSNTNVGASDTDLRITNTGNVGIGLGNTDPSQKLHVSGTIRQTNATSAVLVADANGDIKAATNLIDQAYSTTDTTEAAADTYHAIPTDWVFPPPATVEDALHRLAAAIAPLIGGQIP